MREAAWRAGLVDHKESDQLLIILEPEAAMLHAHVTELEQMAPGTTVMMVDAGGGTVDLTAHTVQRQASGQLVLAEAAPGMGGFCGSTFVDRNFEQWFRMRVGVRAFDAWRSQYYGEYQQVRGTENTSRCVQQREPAGALYGGYQQVRGTAQAGVRYGEYQQVCGTAQAGVRYGEYQQVRDTAA